MKVKMLRDASVIVPAHTVLSVSDEQGETLIRAGIAVRILADAKKEQANTEVKVEKKPEKAKK